MIELGVIIKEKRIFSLFEIMDVSKMLKIKPEYIEAIERDDIGYFSSEIYYYGYLKQYLKLLEIHDIKINTQSIAQNQELSINIPAATSYNPNLLLTIVSLIFSIIIYNLSDSFISKSAINPIVLDLNNKTPKFVDLR